MAAVKARWIDPLFSAFNAAFPRRAKGSDGWIGDEEHQQQTSGHNPDDTPGVRAERSDPDSKQEVRAADVTSALRSLAGVVMYAVVQRVLVTPADRDRLIYIICDGWIWRAANGWRREKYDGDDQHFGHAHFSGHPDADENGNPWLSVLSFMEEDMPLSDSDVQKVVDGVWTRALRQGAPGYAGQQAETAQAFAWAAAQTAVDLLKAIALKVDLDPAEIEAIEQASERGAAAALQAAQAGLVQAIIAALPESGSGDGGALTPADVERAAETAVRTVLGGLDATPGAGSE